MCIRDRWNGAWSGVPFAGIEVKVIDEMGNEVPRGAQGEEISRGPHMFVGYLNERDRTDRALDDEGWFYSGDLCYMDEEGRIRINGRKKEVIILSLIHIWLGQGVLCGVGAGVAAEGHAVGDGVAAQAVLAVDAAGARCV